eukprot:1250677-Amphidinium_carterae.1
MEQDFRAYLVLGSIRICVVNPIRSQTMISAGVVKPGTPLFPQIPKELSTTWERTDLHAHSPHVCGAICQDLKAHIEHFVPSLAYEAHHYHHEERVSRIKFAEMLGDEQASSASMQAVPQSGSLDVGSCALPVFEWR